MANDELEKQADRAAGSGNFAEAQSLLEQAIANGSSGFVQWMKLSAMRRAASELTGALEAVDQALAHSPLDFSALLSRAMILERLGDPRAGQEFGNALAQTPDDIPATMLTAVQHAQGRWSDHQRQLEAHLLQQLPPDLSQFERSQMERFISNRARRTRNYHQEPSDFHYPGLPEFEFHDVNLFPSLVGLELATDAIRAEFQELLTAEAAEMVPYIQYPERVPLGQWRELNLNRNWTAIHLLQNGCRVEANARHCPRTMDILAKLPQPHVAGASPNAMFSPPKPPRWCLTFNIPSVCLWDNGAS